MTDSVADQIVGLTLSNFGAGGTFRMRYARGTGDVMADAFRRVGCEVVHARGRSLVNITVSGEGYRTDGTESHA